jgi:hypothetical protein
MAGQLLAHFDQVHRKVGWIPLDERNAAAPAYRRRIADGIAASGSRPDPTPVPTPVMAARLLETLEAITT